jgi:hypothetical protein
MPVLNPPPPTELPDPVGDYARAQSWSLVLGKYADAGAWATWAVNLMNDTFTQITDTLNSAVDPDFADLKAAIDAITLYTPPVVGFTYNAPTVPTFDEIPAFEAQQLGTILAIPAVQGITVGDAPSTALQYTSATFSDSLLDTLRARLSADVTAYSSGLGDAEAALFSRAVLRENSARAAAYSEVTAAFSARGFDLPPGALTAKQTEMNNESNIRLSDQNSQITAESARLALDYNKHILSVSTQLLDLLAKVFDSKEVRDFDAAKTQVQLALEGFKETVAVALARAELNKAEIAATVAANDGTVRAFQAAIEGELAPIRAIADGNQAKASVYTAQVQGAAANLNAQVIPEELKIKGVEANGQLMIAKADLTSKEALMAIEDARNKLQMELEPFRALAQGAQQIIASAMNGVNVSAGFGWSASASTSYQGA